MNHNERHPRPCNLLWSFFANTEIRVELNSAWPWTSARLFANQECSLAEEAKAIRERVEQLMRGWREAPIDHEALARHMREQSTRMAVMLAFLDQQVPPGQGQMP